jgi:hypothetical protein
MEGGRDRREQKRKTLKQMRPECLPEKSRVYPLAFARS